MSAGERLTDPGDGDAGGLLEPPHAAADVTALPGCEQAPGNQSGDGQGASTFLQSQGRASATKGRPHFPGDCLLPQAGLAAGSSALSPGRESSFHHTPASECSANGVSCLPSVFPVKNNNVGPRSVEALRHFTQCKCLPEKEMKVFQHWQPFYRLFSISVSKPVLSVWRNGPAEGGGRAVISFWFLSQLLFL